MDKNKTVVENRGARFHYEVKDTFVAGMVLFGWEVKSLRAGRANLRNAWIQISAENLLWLKSLEVQRWQTQSPAPTAAQRRRDRQLLVNKRELKRITHAQKEKRLTLVPLGIDLVSGKYLKCRFALAQGRKRYEKRQVLRERSLEQQARQALKTHQQKS